MNKRVPERKKRQTVGQTASGRGRKRARRVRKTTSESYMVDK